MESSRDRLQRFLIPAVLLYVAAITLFLIWRGVSVSPDLFLLVLLVGAVVLGKWKAFLVDWLPFVVLFLGYEALRGLAGSTGIAVHYSGVIAADNVIGLGHQPTILLQEYFYRPGHVSVLDVVATFFYFLHFAFPLTLGYVLWIRDRNVFRRFAAALLAMSFAAFIFFLLVPVAPPWLASVNGYLPHVEKIIEHTIPSATTPFYQHLNPNKVAAMPSLHAAFPVLGLLYALRLFGPRAWPVGLWCLMVLFSIVYLGEHYVIDAVAGALLATVAFVAVEAIYRRFRDSGEVQATEPDARLGAVDAVDV